jgi:hypothetical protein
MLKGSLVKLKLGIIQPDPEQMREQRDLQKSMEPCLVAPGMEETEIQVRIQCISILT